MVDVRVEAVGAERVVHADHVPGREAEDERAQNERDGAEGLACPVVVRLLALGRRVASDHADCLAGSAAHHGCRVRARGGLGGRTRVTRAVLLLHGLLRRASRACRHGRECWRGRHLELPTGLETRLWLLGTFCLVRDFHLGRLARQNGRQRPLGAARAHKRRVCGGRCCHHWFVGGCCRCLALLRGASRETRAYGRRNSLEEIGHWRFDQYGLFFDLLFVAAVHANKLPPVQHIAQILEFVVNERYFFRFDWIGRFRRSLVCAFVCRSTRFLAFGACDLRISGRFGLLCRFGCRRRWFYMFVRVFSIIIYIL